MARCPLRQMLGSLGIILLEEFHDGRSGFLLRQDFFKTQIKYQASVR